jgi:hypothetical protein
MSWALFDTSPPLDGSVFEPVLDDERLTKHARVFDPMCDGAWRTLPEIAYAIGVPPASIGSQLRHLRRPRFGGDTMRRRRASCVWGPPSVDS